MKRNISNNLLIVICLLAMVSCKAKKHLVGVSTPITATTTVAPPPVVKIKPDTRDVFKGSQLAFNTFSSKANAKLDIDGDKNDAVLNIHIDRDKKIWVSVSVTVLLTIEVARAVITPDSIQMVDKLHHTYIKKPFSFLYQYANNQINYKMLEAILTGNPLQEIMKDNNASIQTANGNTNISGTLEELVYMLIMGQNMKVGQLNLSNHNAGQSLQVTNSNFIQVAGKTVPSQIDIQSVAQNKKIQVNLHYTNVDLDQPLQYTFNIPDSYKPADGN